MTCAPEVILGNNYGPSVDYWSLGIILFELLTDTLPFHGENDISMMDQIVKEHIDYQCLYDDENIPEAAIDLVKSFLILEPERRITAKQALDHEWFDDIKGGEAGRAGQDFSSTMDVDGSTSNRR